MKEGKGEPLVLVQGYCCKLESWHFQTSFFRDKMTVIAFDNRGVGKSSRPNYRYTINMFIEDIKDLMNHLKIKEKIHLCGFSNGGGIVQQFTLRYPRLVKTLMLFGTAYYMDPVEYEQYLKLLDMVVKNSTIEEQIQMTLPNMFSASFRKELENDKELFDKYKKDMGLIAHLNNPPRYQDHINQWTAMKDFDTTDLLHKINQPTLIMVGSKDKENLKASKFIHDQVPNSRLEIIEGAGHAFFIETSKETNNIMWDFLQTHLDL